uniref:Putative secreted protein n=1 Tax=Amblyomma cajennense TaxID=34607 RepID=A0A023FBJ2_AMBCJ
MTLGQSHAVLLYLFCFLYLMGHLGTCYCVLVHKKTGQWLLCVFSGTHITWTSQWMARDRNKQNKLTEVLQRILLICSYQTLLRNYLLIVPEMC